MKYYLEKKPFYDKIKKFENRHTPIFFFHDFGSKNQYTICFDWSHEKPDGTKNFTASCQLYDNRKSGAGKYIAEDLIFDMLKEGITTDYKLYIFLRDWIQKHISVYECELRHYEQNCEDCGFCSMSN